MSDYFSQYFPRMQLLARNYIGVRCRIARKPMRYILDPEPDKPIFLVSAGEEVFEIDPKIEIFTQDGEKIQPTGRFFRTSHTIDPYHAILDIWDLTAIM